MEKVLSKEEFMDLVRRDIEAKKKAEQLAQARRDREFLEFKINQSQKYGSRYTKNKKVRR